MSLLPRVRALGLPAYGDHEVLFFERVLERHRPTHVFEWGTNVGASARLFYEASLELGYECDVHTTEIPDELSMLDRDHPGHRYGTWIEGLPIHAHRGYGLIASLALHESLRPERSLFYLDGNHSYGVVRAELEGVWGCDPSAVIMVHDTIRYTGEAVTDFVRRYPHYRRSDCNHDSGLAALWPLA